jgi:hypothetical protein
MDGIDESHLHQRSIALTDWPPDWAAPLFSGLRLLHTHQKLFIPCSLPVRLAVHHSETNPTSHRMLLPSEPHGDTLSSSYIQPAHSITSTIRIFFVYNPHLPPASTERPSVRAVRPKRRAGDLQGRVTLTTTSSYSCQTDSRVLCTLLSRCRQAMLLHRLRVREEMIFW